MSKLSVKQEDRFGCGVACVAGALEISYEEAKQFFKKPQDATRRGHGCQAIRFALRNAGLDYSFRKMQPAFEPLLSRLGTIAFIGRSQQYRFGHYVLRVESGWMNSWGNCPFYPIRACVETTLPGKVEWILYRNE